MFSSNKNEIFYWICSNLKMCRISWFDWWWCMDIGYTKHTDINTQWYICIVCYSLSVCNVYIWPDHVCDAVLLLHARRTTHSLAHMHTHTHTRYTIRIHHSKQQANKRMELKEWQPECERLAQSEFSTQHNMVASVSSVDTLRAFSDSKYQIFCCFQIKESFRFSIENRS